MHLSGATIAFSSQWPSAPPEIFCVGTGGKTLRRISNVNAELRAVHLVPVRRTSHAATDGRRIESFLMYPPHRVKGHPAPTVLEIHGGPHSWHPQTGLLGLYQALACAGFVVVLPNPRGSHGYGEDFSKAVLETGAGQISRT